MNKLIIPIISSCLLVGTGTALAQNPDEAYGNKGHRQQRGMQGNPQVDHMLRAVRQLDLDDDQRADIKSIIQTLKADSRAIMGETKALQPQLAELIKAENFDEAAVATLAAQEGELSAERTILTSQALSEIYALMTPEQRAELDIMATERMSQRGDRHTQRASDG